jgi:hypothetical protein
VFTPDASSPNGYSYAVTGGTSSLPVEPGSGLSTVTVELENDEFEEVALDAGDTITLYGATYASLFVSSNGFVTFGEGSASRSASAAAHFLLAGVAGLRCDLDPQAGGQVVVDQGEGFVAVTFEEVLAIGSGTPNTFQIVFAADGTIAVHLVSLAALDALVGLSCEAGHTLFPTETDFLP